MNKVKRKNHIINTYDSYEIITDHLCSVQRQNYSIMDKNGVQRLLATQNLIHMRTLNHLFYSVFNTLCIRRYSTGVIYCNV